MVPIVGCGPTITGTAPSPRSAQASSRPVRQAATTGLEAGRRAIRGRGVTAAVQDDVVGLRRSRGIGLFVEARAVREVDAALSAAVLDRARAGSAGRGLAGRSRQSPAGTRWQGGGVRGIGGTAASWSGKAVDPARAGTCPERAVVGGPVGQDVPVLGVGAALGRPAGFQGGAVRASTAVARLPALRDPGGVQTRGDVGRPGLNWSPPGRFNRPGGDSRLDARRRCPPSLHRIRGHRPPCRCRGRGGRCRPPRLGVLRGCEPLEPGDGAGGLR